MKNWKENVFNIIYVETTGWYFFTFYEIIAKFASISIYYCVSFFKAAKLLWYKSILSHKCKVNGLYFKSIRPFDLGISNRRYTLSLGRIRSMRIIQFTSKDQILYRRELYQTAVFLSLRAVGKIESSWKDREDGKCDVGKRFRTKFLPCKDKNLERTFELITFQHLDISNYPFQPHFSIKPCSRKQWLEKIVGKVYTNSVHQLIGRI